MNTEAENTAPVNPGPSHLDLEELLAKVNGEMVSDRAREHLATCRRCHAEALRWDIVAGGVRSLVAAAPEVARPSLPRRGRLPALAGRKPRTMMAASAAAAILLLAGAGYGLTAALTGPAGTGTKTATLTAVSGCDGLKLAKGTLEQVSGTSLVITTSSGQPVTVTTSASTMVSEQGAPLSDVTDGASAIAAGPETDGTIAAQHVEIGPPPRVYKHDNGMIETPPGIVAVQGTVADASTGGFTVVTSTGTRVPVTTSSETDVGLFHASLSQLRIGATTFAIGRVRPDGTFAAIAVLQPQPAFSSRQIQVRGCTPASVDNAITTALIAG